MAECMLMQGGGGIKSDDVTAVASDVRLGKTYLGSDSDDDIKTGTAYMIDNLYNQSITVDRYGDDMGGYTVSGFGFTHGIVGVVSVTFQVISGDVQWYTVGASAIGTNSVTIKSKSEYFGDGHVKVTVTAKGY